MKNPRDILRWLLPHAVVILSFVTVTLLILHLYNPRMGFLTSSGSQRIIGTYVVLSFILALQQTLKK